MFAANSAKSLLKPYFADIIEQFKPYLAPHSEAGGLSEEDMRKLQIQTLGTDKDTKRLEEEVNIQTVVAHFVYLLHSIFRHSKCDCQKYWRGNLCPYC